jgi:hypothetical protein
MKQAWTLAVSKVPSYFWAGFRLRVVAGSGGIVGIAEIECPTKRNLAKIANAHGSLACLLRLSKNGKKDRGEDCDDRNDDQ